MGAMQIFEQVVRIHENDQNFPVAVLEKMKEFLGNDDIFSNPDAHEKLIHEMKVEAALIYNNRLAGMCGRIIRVLANLG